MASQTVNLVTIKVTNMFKVIALSATLLPSVVFAGQCDNWLSDNFWQNATSAQVTECIVSQNVPAGDAEAWTTPLQLAAGSSDRPDLIATLAIATYGVDSTDSLGNTPLHIAARYNDNASVIAALVAAGNDVNGATEDGSSPLHIAAYGNASTDVVAALIEAGADLSATDGNGRTALHIASAFSTNPDIILALIEAGSDLAALDNMGKAPFDYIENGPTQNAEVFKLLQAAIAAASSNG